MKKFVDHSFVIKIYARYNKTTKNFFLSKSAFFATCELQSILFFHSSLKDLSYAIICVSISRKQFLEGTEFQS